MLHSGLTEAERRDERERIVAAEAPVVVGARSAVFAPVQNLGLICVDEEHDSSYKQESTRATTPARGGGEAGRASRAVAVYGSATPRSRRAGSGSSGSSSASASARRCRA